MFHKLETSCWNPLWRCWTREAVCAPRQMSLIDFGMGVFFVVPAPRKKGSRGRGHLTYICEIRLSHSETHKKRNILNNFFFFFSVITHPHVVPTP